MADTLFRAPPISDSLDFQESTEAFILLVVEALPSNVVCLEWVAKAQLIDPTLEVTRYCKE